MTAGHTQGCFFLTGPRTRASFPAWSPHLQGVQGLKAALSQALEAIQVLKGSQAALSQVLGAILGLKGFKEQAPRVRQDLGEWLA